MDQRLLQKLLADAQKNKKLLDEKLKEIQSSEFTANVGGGMFSLTANGKYEIVDCSISDAAMADKETLQDLIITGLNDVISQINNELKKAETQFLPKGFF